MFYSIVSLLGFVFGSKKSVPVNTAKKTDAVSTDDDKEGEEQEHEEEEEDDEEEEEAASEEVSAEKEGVKKRK